jgi:excinuclease ABC subunit C
MNTPSDTPTASLSRGVDIIKNYLTTLPDRPGVYRMLSTDDVVLYVGKAKALKKRVTNYTQPDRLSGRIQRMVSLTYKMEFVETHTEAEALLLEANLIKKLNPIYNVLLKDDKMYPHIMVPRDHDFPGVTKHRGARKRDAYYYGPFLSGTAVNDTITLLHKVFQIRNCTDGYFAARKRPCLQYHIKRCTAPCVGKVSREDYAAQIKNARAFLDGKSRDVQDDFAAKMQAASAAQDYETAALYRDKITLLTAMLSKQNINLSTIRDADVIAAVRDRGTTAIQVFFFRSGQNYGNVAYYPKHAEDETIETVMSAFMGQFYANKTPPADIIISHMPDEYDFLFDVLCQKAGRKIDLSVPKRGARHDVLDFALNNATQALERHLATTTTQTKLLDGVRDLFDLAERPKRIEVYDNSHLGGTGQVGAMIVAGPDGFIKNAYRKFNIRDAGASDDYAMMREVMERRFRQVAGPSGLARGTQDINGKGSSASAEDLSFPSLVLIDGGLGQLHAVKDTLTELGVWNSLNVVAISKGPDRNAGREWFHRDGQPPFQLPVNDPVLHYLQRLRDEAHRFAIGTQRARRTSTLTKSILDQIPGIGAKRKKALLLHFGSAKAVTDAALDDLSKVDGISKAFAEKLYFHFHS